MGNHRTTSRILDVFDLLAANIDEKMTLSNIAVFLNVPKSTLFPILQTLVSRGYLNYDENTYIYSIGASCYEIGMKYIENGFFNADVDKIISKITQECQETCHFAELIGNEVFYINKKDSPQSIRMFSSPGKKLPAYSTGLGKALLSDKSMEQIKRLYPKGLSAITDNTITSFDVLYEQIKKIRKDGFAYEIEESNQHIRCIAVPIRVSGKVKYAISVAVPVFRYTKEKEQQIQSLLTDAKNQLEKRLVLSL
jgi:IclR family KDG regulon transcriptional repressor